MKFGGTSVADAECIRRISKIAVEESKKHNVIVVVSAMGKTTDSLVKQATEISDNPDCRELDMLLATGELISISLTAMNLKQMGYPAISLTGWQAGFITESDHNKARIAEIRTDRIKKHLSNGEIVVVAGFQGITEAGEVTTLGRGGSDTSAVALAAELNASRCDIYTDVNGVFTTDPRIVPEAQQLSDISYEEMVELASLGAKVLHPRSVELAKKYNVDLRVRSSFNQDNKGTKVISLKKLQEMELTKPVTGIAVDNKQARMAVMGVPDQPGTAAKLFGTLSKHGVSVDMIIQSIAHDGTNVIAFTINKENLSKAKEVCDHLLPELGAQGLFIDDKISKVSIVGAGMLNRPGVASNMFKSLSDEGINIHMIATSEIKISCIIDIENSEKAVTAIHKTFELEKSTEPVIA